jgi:hypothetical protein
MGWKRASGFFVLALLLISHTLWDDIVAPRGRVIAALKCHFVAKYVHGQKHKAGEWQIHPARLCEE